MSADDSGHGEGGIHLTQAEAVSLLGASVRPDESRTILQTLSDMKLSDLSMHATYALLNLALDGDGKVPESLDGTAFRKLFCDLFDALGATSMPRVRRSRIELLCPGGRQPPTRAYRLVIREGRGCAGAAGARHGAALPGRRALARSAGVAPGERIARGTGRGTV
ncbi:hypothetical protein [Pandoraea pnomenusa]|uniref:hypothetical protein n=1 Tax=Pandoraea pnomenusa TaxID=93220 RepID=UPI0007BCB5F6|nr:hypothetical protein [Pandoraea pnomenusa]ANC42896.1 hypothetical protein A6P55_00015 [Pandoraea pnomenusa]